jgi:hypothetical protein
MPLAGPDDLGQITFDERPGAVNHTISSPKESNNLLAILEQSYIISPPLMELSPRGDGT